MKMLVFILSSLVFATHVLAAQEEVLFSCKGGKTTSGVVPIYKVESLRSGRWVSTVEAEGVMSEGDVPYDVITLSNQSKKDNGCVVTLDQKINGKPRTLNLVYADKELTLKDKTASNFGNAPCRIISKNLRKQLNDCQIKDKEEVSQGMLCRSDNSDDTEIHIRIDSNKDVSYTERTVYQVYQGKASKLGTRSSEITSNLVSDGNECVVTVTESKESADRQLRLVIRLKKPFADAALGRVEVSKITAKTDDGKTETVTMPDQFKNMKCEFMGDLAAKISECKVDTLAATDEATPTEAKKPAVKPASPKPATNQKAAQ
ncbi:MAG: hypothetical protein JSU04_03595 [Bdellovibrionales bacterium]|nr:hypothetical protein [Bdellovibrionales bacterium]